MTDSGNPATGSPPGWQHSELLGRRSLFGAIALLAAVAMFFFLPPFIDGQVEYATAGPDGRFALDDFASIEIAEGWGIDSQSEILTVIAKGGASAVLTPTVETATSASQYAQLLVDGLNDSGTWIVDSIQDFTTDAGVQGSSYLAHGTDQVAASWIIVDAGRLSVFNGLASESAFKDGIDDFDQMAKSILFESTTGAGG
jgi:hypothetical protein